MTTSKLLLLRIYNIVIGRFDIGKKILRKVLEVMLIKKKYTERYSPCTKYFNIKYFKDEK